MHNVSTSLEALLTRCNVLWNELESFREHLKQQKREHHVELSHFRGVVKSELKNLERLSRREQDAREAAAETESDVNEHNTSTVPKHTVASSNLPFLESVWNAVKSSTGLQALQKRFYFGDVVDNARVVRGKRACRGRGARNETVRKGRALVDVVTGDGLEWIKVSLVTNHRMLMDKAREGWGGDSSDESEQEDTDDPDSGIPIVRVTSSLVEAARTVRIRTKHPRIRIILPKIVQGESAEVDNILSRLRAMGVSVECTEEPVASRPLSTAIDHILTDPFGGLTPTLNIDCTILLALVSDFSHCAVSAEPWFHRALKRQIEIEDQENLLPSTLYPAVKGHRLVCTKEAARRMREIVDTIGTQGEKVRTALFMGDDGKTEDVARRELQEWSKFEVPGSLQLPVTEVETSEENLPSVADEVRKNLTEINQSVFLYGWSTGHMTITSNRTVVKVIDHVLDRLAESEQEWPKIWLCPTARSLVGKEKGRKE